MESSAEQGEWLEADHDGLTAAHRQFDRVDVRGFAVSLRRVRRDVDLRAPQRRAARGARDGDLARIVDADRDG